MNPGTSRVQARCAGCGRGYRVPDASRTYPCKVCGEAVRALPAEAPEDVRRQEAADRRHAATSALKRAAPWIAGVRWLYRLGAVAYAVAALLAILALARTDVPEGPGILVVALATLLSVLMGMGAMHILFRPFAWNLAIALLSTAVSIVHLIGPDPLGIAFLGSGAWALFAWAALVPTLRFRRLISEHKDLYVLHHASMETRRSLKGRSPEERHERLVNVMRRASLRTWKLSTAIAMGVVLASALGTRQVVAHLRPQPLDEARAAFEDAWNRDDRASAWSFFDEAVREQQTTWLTGVIGGHGWDVLPRLQDGRTRVAEGRTWVDYSCDDVPLSAGWLLDGQVWRLVRIELPVPPLEPVFERFLEHWRISDPEGLVAFFSRENQTAMLESIESSVRRRGWDPFPAILESSVRDHRDGNAEATFTLESGRVTTRWHLRGDGTWGLHALEFPRFRQ